MRKRDVLIGVVCGAVLGFGMNWADRLIAEFEADRFPVARECPVGWEGK